MKVLNELILKLNKKKYSIFFGIPDTELQEMFSFRFRIYSKNNYFNKNIPYGPLDVDEYDRINKCDYFVAKFNNEIIGTVRVIKDEFLPTESECFKFVEPAPISKIPRASRGELGRLIIVSPSIDQHFPRNIVLLFLIKSIIDFYPYKKFEGGYAFVTKKLYNKLRKLRIPIYLVDSYKLTYPANGLLYPYFSQKDNEIYPIFFLNQEIKRYIDLFLSKKIISKIVDRQFRLNDSLYNKLLSALKII